MGHFFKKMFYGFLYVAMIGAIAVSFPLVLGRLLKTETPLAAITSNSMWPVLKRGDLVLIKKINLAQIQPEDIIVWKNQAGFVIHRIKEIDRVKKMVITKGDANNLNDKPVSFKEIIGQVIMISDRKPFRIPLLGNITIFTREAVKNKIL